MSNILSAASAQEAKEAVGRVVAKRIEDGMRLGLGTGSTAAMAIKSLGERIRDENLRCVGVATSFAAERLAMQHGVPTTSLDRAGRLDFAFDGADEVSEQLDLIKGRGGAHTREKVVASVADQFVVLVDESKLVTELGERVPVPVEVLPMASHPVQRAIESLGGVVELRMGAKKDGPLVTDQGFWILDARFGSIASPAELSTALLTIPGVLDHGLFVGLATEVLVGSGDGTIRTLKP